MALNVQPVPNKGVELTAYSVRSVRREKTTTRQTYTWTSSRCRRGSHSRRSLRGPVDAPDELRMRVASRRHTIQPVLRRGSPMCPEAAHMTPAVERTCHCPAASVGRIS